MKKIFLILCLLLVPFSLASAQVDSNCFDQCFSQSSLKSDSDRNYCQAECSRIQDPYAKLQLDIARQTLDLQKQQFELQKQTLELQKQMLDLQKKPQATAPAEKVIEGKQE